MKFFMTNSVFYSSISLSTRDDRIPLFPVHGYLSENRKFIHQIFLRKKITNFYLTCPDKVDTFAYIERLICAINCTPLDCYNVLVDLDNYTGMAGMSSYVIMALDRVPIAGLANLLQSIHRSLHLLYRGI